MEEIKFIFALSVGAFISNIDRIQPWLEKQMKRLGEKMSGDKNE